MRLITIVGVMLAFAVVPSGIPTAWASTLNFQVIADTNTPIPGGTGTFSGLSMVYSADGPNTLVFCGVDSFGRVGAYSYIGGKLNVVADARTPVPGGAGTFASIPFEDISGNNIIVVGFDATGYGGIFSATGGVINPLVTTATAIPGGVGNFTGFAPASISGDDVAFRAFGASGQTGIYTVF